MVEDTKKLNMNFTEDNTRAPPSKDSTMSRNANESQLKKTSSEKKDIAPISVG